MERQVQGGTAGCMRPVGVRLVLGLQVLFRLTTANHSAGGLCSKLQPGIQLSKLSFALFILFRLLNLVKICQRCFIFNLPRTTWNLRQLFYDGSQSLLQVKFVMWKRFETRKVSGILGTRKRGKNPLLSLFFLVIQ